MGAMEDLLAGVEKAKASSSGVNINPGKYKFEVQKAVIEPSTRKGPMFIAEFLVLEAVPTDAAKPPNVVGSTCSYAVKLAGEFSESAFGDVKSFLMGITGEPEKNITKEAVGLLLDPKERPLRFMTVTDEAFEKPQKANKEKMFTHHKWGYTGVEAEQIALGKREAEKKEQAAAAAAK